MNKHIIVIGAGFAGLSAAACLAKKGFKVTILEKNDIAGGRARKFSAEGFTFDMGPSWYWMPDVFERYFNLFGKSVTDFYELKRLDPSYKVVWSENESTDIPADFQQFMAMCDAFEPGAGERIKSFLDEAAYKYEVGINKLVYKPSRSLTEFLDIELITGVFKLDVFTSMSKHIRRFTSHPRLIELLEFPVLFLGATPQNTPALYSLMNYADIKLGTWYPIGGMHRIVEAMVSIAESQGVTIKLSHEVKGYEFDALGNITKVRTHKGDFTADLVVAGADYHHAEANLLPKEKRSYTEKYWEKRVMAPSSLLYYVGLSEPVNKLPHHTLFFDRPFERHAHEIYTEPRWPEDPLFYVSLTTKTDASGAPEGMENMFVLIPAATGLDGDDEELRIRYFNLVMDRMEKYCQQDIRSKIVYMRTFAHSDFIADYHAFKGNAYGLANTLNQTAILKPSLKSKKVKNLFYAGQLTVPGPGVPPSIISGQVVANEVEKFFH
ncbi:MAG: phytoene desaturase family protein [Flavobacteriales bacterium]